MFKKYDLSSLFAAGVIAMTFALGGCAVSSTDGDYTVFGKDTGINAASAQANAAATFATVCPEITVLAAAPPAGMSAFQKAALTQLVGACASPPTSVAALTADALAAYEALAPLVHQLKPAGT